MGKAKKIIAGVLVVAVAGTGIGAGLMQLRKNSQKEVEVTPVSGPDYHIRLQSVFCYFHITVFYNVKFLQFFG